MKQKKARVEDALHATRAAAEEGILPGGGVALLRCREAVEKVRAQRPRRREDRRRHRAAGVGQPISQIADNCGVDGSVIADEVSEKPTNIGYDANTGEVRRHVQGRHHRPAEGGADRPCRMRASIAALMLTTETLVTDLNKEDKKKRRSKGASGEASRRS